MQAKVHEITMKMTEVKSRLLETQVQAETGRVEVAHCTRALMC
jgi:hypothetical protein